MQRITAPGHVNNRFVDEDENTGQPPTYFSADWFNAVQEEICGVVEGADLELDSSNNGQLFLAVKALIKQFSTDIGDIKIWRKPIAEIPTGWHLCDGTNGTIDLRNRFIIGANADYEGVAKTTVTGAALVTGGSKDTTLPYHDHPVIDPGHLHNYKDSYYIENDGAGAGPTVDGTDILTSGVRGSHSTDNDNNRIYFRRLDTEESTTGLDVGWHGEDDGTNTNLPPFYALAYIERIA